jgi:hypothetical protein
MAINFIIGGFVEAVGFVGVGSMNVFTFHYPDADAFLPAGIHIPCIFYRHPGISRMKGADMFMIKSLLAPDKNFP